MAGLQSDAVAPGPATWSGDLSVQQAAVPPKETGIG